MSKLKFTSEIAKDIFIIDQFINEDGLGIQYLNGSKELEMSLDPIDAAELLSKYGVIPACDNTGRVLDEDVDGFMKWIEWESYVLANRLDERTAFHIVCGEESEKTMQSDINNLKAIPALLTPSLSITV